MFFFVKYAVLKITLAADNKVASGEPRQIIQSHQVNLGKTFKAKYKNFKCSLCKFPFLVSGVCILSGDFTLCVYRSTRAR